MSGLIQWRKKDYKKLRSEINKFNRRINKLENSGKSIILPDVLKYKDVKSNIYTRKEFNRVIKSIQAFNDNLSSQERTVLHSGLEITKWEERQLKKLKKTAVKNLTKELKELDRGFGTGNTRRNEIKSTLESLEGWENKRYEQFRRIRNRIKYLGYSDLEIKQAKLFQRNFIKAYKKMGRTEIVEKAKEFKNPLEFWDFIKNSELTDITLSYDQDAGMIRLNMDADDTYYYELFKLGINL